MYFGSRGTAWRHIRTRTPRTAISSFLSTGELEHAHDILHSLLQVVVDCLAPPFTVLTVEGDAVFACAREDKVDRGEFLLESFEMTYMAFRDRIETIRRQKLLRPSLDRMVEVFAQEEEHPAETVAS